MECVIGVIWFLDDAVTGIVKGMLQRNIEHFQKKHVYEKLGFSEMK